MKTLETGVRNARNVGRYLFGRGGLDQLDSILRSRREMSENGVVFFVDEYFENNSNLVSRLSIQSGDRLKFISTVHEPTTDYINSLRDELVADGMAAPCAIVGVGGGITMDSAKAVSNLLTNGGRAEDYQGWDLVKIPGIYKIGVPTLSGTGAEATRTCVMTNKRSGLKLGMNSDFTVFDQIVLDPDLTATAPRNQYFYTGMDAYIHCIESSAGYYRNAIGDAYSRETINLCRQVFLEGDMMAAHNREKLMVASYLGGCAIATSYVGVVHPFSAGLSVVLGIHHCVGNCITMRAMAEFYPEEYSEFWKMVELQNVEIPSGLCKDLSDDQYDRLYESTVVHEKPLTNALGEDFKSILTREKVKELFQSM
ncbi:MAG: iron-containing alcohol dehydrogenase [bacterium]|nr:iron-containing alcohol dehydrogenase [bacterium]